MSFFITEVALLLCAHQDHTQELMISFLVFEDKLKICHNSRMKVIF